MSQRFRGYVIPVFIFLIALAVRIKPFVYSDQFFLIPVDFDEGVYYGASIFLTKGVLPYRDFDFGHPPGIVWLFSLWHWLIPVTSAAKSFAFAKIAMAILGSFTSLGVYVLGKKWHGTLAAIIAAVLYASYPEVVASDRSIFLEPFINAAAVLALLIYESKKQRWITIGLLLAFSLSIKVTAVIWIPAFAWLAWQSGRLPKILSFAKGGCLGIAVFFLPWILIDPAKFWEGVIQFQLVRPPDGDIALTERLSSILRDQHLAMNIFSALGLILWPYARQRVRDMGAALTLALVLSLVVLLSSKGYWSQYNTLLAMPQALLASFSVSARVSWLYRRWSLAALGLLLIAFPIRSAFKSGRARSVDQLKLVQSLEQLPKNNCVFSFEPAWLIMSDHFPSPCSGRQILDTYLVMLMDARAAGAMPSSTGAAFASDASQTRVLSSIQGADTVVLGPRGQAQLNDKTKKRIFEVFQPQGELLLRLRHIDFGRAQ